jgi:hypothetical protein
MSRSGGTSTIRAAAALTGTALQLCLLSGTLAACAYEDGGDPPATAAPSSRPGRTVPAVDPNILATQTRNFAELDRRLATVTGRLVLADAGPADGPSVGFRKAATVETSGPHTVTAACVGIPMAQIYLTQQVVGGTEAQSVQIDCSATSTQVVQLHEGYVSAQLTRVRPEGPWTGAVAGIKITGP